jgi:hypothetical protein
VGAEDHGGGIVNLVFEAALQFEELAFGEGQGAVEIGLGQADGTGFGDRGAEEVLADAGGEAHAHAGGGPLPADAMGARAEAGSQGFGSLGSGIAGGAVETHEELDVFDDAGELGGDDAEGLDIVWGEIIPLGILDDDDADRIHLALNGHGQEGNKMFLLAAGDLLPMRVVDAVGFADGAHFLEGGAGDALAQLEAEAADHAGMEALVGAQNQLMGFRLVKINGADGRAHVPGDGGDGLHQERIEAGLEIEEADEFADVAHQRYVVLLKIAHGGFVGFQVPILNGEA